MIKNDSILKEYIKRYKGVSVLKNGIKEYKTGFTLATDKSTYKTFKTITQVILYVKKHNFKNYGVWYDKNIKKYGIDTDIIRVNKKSEAVKLCKLYKQEAFFKWDNKTSVYI